MAEPTPLTDLGRLRILSPKAGVRVSPLQLGSMSIGDACAAAMAFKLLDAFDEPDGNFITVCIRTVDRRVDSARKNRDSLVLATKFSMDYRSHALGNGPHIHVGISDSLKKLELMDALHILVKQGKVLYLGVSDTPAWITSFSIYQGRWNLLVRDFERDIIPMARQFGIALAA
ncbi:hypothetical protein V1523DRAFT_441308 [Lipomyces doorenjongii]